MAKKTYNPISGGGYGWAGMDPIAFHTAMLATSRKMKELKEEYKIDALAFTGSSGAAAAFVLGFKHNMHLIYVRKEGEKCHGSNIEFNGESHIRKYLIVDDFIGQGTTVKRIITRIDEYCKSNGCHKAKPVGVLLFDTAGRNETRDFDRVKLICWAPNSDYRR